MSSSLQPSASDTSAPPRLARWKIWFSVGATLVLSPVIGLGLGFFLLTALPIIPVLAPLVLGLAAGRLHRHEPAVPARPARPTVEPRPWPTEGAAHV
jgi:hypothetical protein